MSTLYKLYFTRMLAGIRNVFSKPSSAIFTLLMIVLYGGLIVLSLHNPEVALSMRYLSNANMAIMIGIGFTAMMVGVMLLQKRKALFMEADAFYLFSGPFTRPQIMRFLLLQNNAGALMSAAFSLLMMILLGSGVQLTLPFLLLAFVCFFLVYFVFLILYYYVYLLSIQDERMNRIPMLAAILYGLIVVGIYALIVIQHGSFAGSGEIFLNTEYFYGVPLFGWIKLVLVSYIAGEWGLLLLGLALMLGACGIVYTLFTHYKGEFVEQAMEDAIAYTALYKDVRAGKRTSMSEKKIKEVKSEFRSGAMALYSKNMLLMRKTNDYLSWMDLLSLGIYLIVTLVTNLGFDFFMYMLVFWLFNSVQNAGFMKDMNNYQLYLLPDRPSRKLFAILLPTCIKMLLPMLTAIVLATIIFQSDMAASFQYFIMLLGYLLLFLAASVLSLRILKSRSNQLLENMLRMLILLAAAAPSVGIMIYVISNTTFTYAILKQITWLSLAMNFILSLAILAACAPMMNGREIKSE